MEKTLVFKISIGSLKTQCGLKKMYKNIDDLENDFFVTETAGDTHGILDGSIIFSSRIRWTSESIIFFSLGETL